jgi:transposase-like protein
VPQTLKETIRAALSKFDLEVRDMIVSRPDLPYRDIGRVFGVSYDVVQRVAKDFGLKRKTGPKPKNVATAPVSEAQRG